MMFCFAVLRLGLSPQEFWALSVAEWSALAETAAPPGMTRDALKALIERYGGGDA